MMHTLMIGEPSQQSDDSLLVACHGAAEERLQLAPAERFNLVTKIHSWNCDLPITHFFCLEFDLEYLCAIVTLTDQTFSFLSFFGFARARRKQQCEKYT